MTAGTLAVVALAGTALVQDAGRALRGVGVPDSGAFDRFAHAAATALVGGTPQQAALEVVGRIDLRPDVAVTVAATGGARLWLGGRPAPGWTAVGVAAGTPVSLSVDRGTGYLAVAGGLCVEPVLGSRSSCVLGPLGPPPVAQGDLLPVGWRGTSGTVGDWCRAEERVGPVRVVPGPHLPMPATSVVVAAVSRIGVRVRPPRPLVATAGLTSLGVLPGAIQVLPSGDWIVLGPDAGTMGGYPVAGVVIDADRDRWAQVAPGDRVDLRPVPADSAPAAAVPLIVRASGLPA